MPDPAWSEILLFLSLIGSLLLCAEAGFRIGRRRRSDAHAQDSQLSTVQAAILGLLALLLGFAYAGATDRFIHRQDIILSEANALGTSYLRADLLDEPLRSELRAALRDYAVARLAFFQHRSPPRSDPLSAQLQTLRQRIWSAAVRGVAAHPELSEVLLEPINQSFDLLSARNNADTRHLPPPILYLLIAAAMLALATIGLGHGLTTRRNTFSVAAFAILTGAALWITIDLDYPRRGIVRINPQPIVDLIESMRP